MRALSNMLLETNVAPASVERLFARSGDVIDALAPVLIDAKVRAALPLLPETLVSASSHAHVDLPVANATHEALDTVSIVQSFYSMVEALAHARGHAPDQPPHLNKVTRTT